MLKMRNLRGRGNLCRITRFALGLCVVCSVAATATAENIITNPNFEGASVGSWSRNIEGWDFSYSTQNVAFQVDYDRLYGYMNPMWCYYTTTSQNKAYGNPGDNFEETTGASLWNTGFVTTEVSLKAGHVYTLTADRATIDESGETYPYFGDLWYYIVDGPVGDDWTIADFAYRGKFSKTGLDMFDYYWRLGWIPDTAGAFTPDRSGTYSLVLYSDGDNFVTNVVLDERVPEPGTWAMLAGLGVVGAAWYRRRRKCPCAH